jgi:aryl-alcohol dehydrogenase-like predicted oxidoreductase
VEYRVLGDSGFAVPVLSFGTATFGTGDHPFFQKWGDTGVAQAKHLVDMCLDAGVMLFDTADVYSDGRAEAVLGEAVKGRRDRVQIATKATFRMTGEPNAVGTSRYHLIRSCEESLRRLGTEYVDIYIMHGFDARTSVDETLRALETLVQSGKVRYIACSNFSGWHLMKSLAVSEKYGWSRYMAHQAHYSLLRREYEWELMPLALDQQVSTIVWGPLSQGRLSGKYRRGQPLPAGTRVAQGAGEGPAMNDDWFYSVVDVLDAVSAETGKTVAQVALNWLLQRPSVASVIIGARDEDQLQENLGAVGWALSAEQVARLDAVSETDTIYPFWHQRGFTERNPTPTKFYR